MHIISPGRETEPDSFIRKTGAIPRISGILRRGETQSAGKERDMYEKAFVYDGEDTERPVRFGFSPEEREYLKKERTTDEIMLFIEEHGLNPAVSNAVFNNDAGFSYFPAFGEVVRKDGRGIFHMRKDAGGRSLDISIGPLTDAEWEQYRLYREHAYFAVVIEGGGTDVSVLMQIDTGAEDGYSELLEEAVMRAFIESAGVNTYHRLGKIINKGRKLMNEYMSAERAFPYADIPPHEETEDPTAAYIRKKAAAMASENPRSGGKGERK